MEQYEHLRALLTLENPTCQICNEDIAELNDDGDKDGDGGGNNAKRRRKIRLVPMPYCKCRTTLASAHVDPSTWPIPDTNSNTTTNPASFLEALLRSQPCRSQQSKTKKSCTFVTTHDNLATCTSCLPAWIQSANHVTKYDYHGDPNGNEMKFTNDVRCAQCHRVFARRTVDRLLEYGGVGGGDGDDEQDEWTRCVEATSRVVEWADGAKEWAQNQWTNESGRDAPSTNLTPEQDRLKSFLFSVVRADGSGMDGDGIHRLEVQHGEVKRELMQRDPKFAQEVEDMEYVRKLAEEAATVAAEEERRQAEADERLARQLAEREKEGDGAESAKSAAAVATKDSAPTTSSILSSYQKEMRQQQEEEKKSEELARKMQEEWEAEERRERERQAKRDAKLARKLHNAGRQEKLGENKRRSPFDAQSGQKGGAATNVVGDVSKTDATASDDEYVRISPPATVKKTATPKASEKQSAKSTATTEAEVLDLANSSSDEDNENDGSKKEKNNDNDTDEPILCTQAETSPTVPVPLSNRKRPPPSSPASNDSAKKRPAKDMKSTPRHRPAAAAADNGRVADFSADQKKMEEWNDDNDTDLQFLVNMGYNWREAKACYLDADLNVERAAAMLSSALEERERAKKLRG